jgi:hypothetical protein
MSHAPATSAKAKATPIAITAPRLSRVGRVAGTLLGYANGEIDSTTGRSARASSASSISSTGVRVVQRKSELAHDTDDAGWAHRAFARHNQAELFALEELHRHELSAIGRLAEAVRIDDVSMA